MNPIQVGWSGVRFKPSAQTVRSRHQTTTVSSPVLTQSSSMLTTMPLASWQAQLGHKLRFGEDSGPKEKKDTIDPFLKDLLLVRVSLKTDMEELLPILLQARDDAYLGYVDKPEPRHLMYTMMMFAKTALHSPKLMDAAPSELQPVGLIFRQCADAVLPPSVRAGKSAEQLQYALEKGLEALKTLNFPKDKPVRKMKELGDNVNVSDELIKGLARFFRKHSKPEDRSLLNLGEFFRNGLVDKDASNQTIQASAIFNNIIKDAQSPLPLTHDPDKRAETPEEFKALLDKHYQGGKGIMSDQQYRAISRMLSKFKKASQGGMGISSPDAQKYLERLSFILEDYPWVESKTTLDARKTQTILDQDHWGLQKPKRKIVQHIAVLKELQDKGLPPLEGKIMCLVGPPGVGKTSLAQSVAKATGRKLAHVALGGVHEEAEIRGHRSTYIGALAGRIAKAFVEAGTQNPIIVLDEVDKMSQGNLHGDPTAALLEVLDPKQNKHFKDHFVGDDIPLDLSKSIILVTANYLERIPEALRDRMEMIQLDAYDEDEKVKIAEKFIVPKTQASMGLTDKDFQLPEKTVRRLIADYTFEAGVRDLQKKIKDLAEVTILNRQLGTPSKPQIEPADLEHLLEPPNTSVRLLKGHVLPDTVGRVNALVVMGDVAGKVESFLGTKRHQPLADPNAPGELVMTPLNKNLKDMTSDSVNNAFTWILDHADELGVTLPQGKRTTFTVTTERGGPVDGDSAGAAITTVALSTLTNRPIRHDVAMTGTISTHGRVLAIGGLKHKLRGAMNAGNGAVKVVFVPKENEDDLKHLPPIMANRFQVLDLAQVAPNQPDANALITKAVQDSQAVGKALVVMTDRIEPILNYTLLAPVTPSAQGQKQAS